MMPRFRKKPVVIEAIRFDGENYDEIGHFVGFAGHIIGREKAIQIKTREGLMIASPGDWIIKGVAGEFYPCKPDIFDTTYEPAEHKVEAWSDDDDEVIYVWGTHDPDVALEAYRKFLRTIGWTEDERPAPNFKAAEELWVHPASDDLDDGPWPRSFISETQRDGWVPLLRASWDT